MAMLLAHSRTMLLALAATALLGLSSMTCKPTEPSALDQMETVDLLIKDQPFRLWIADADPQRERGLMHVTLEQMAPLPDGTQRGMIFIFQYEQQLSFWMKNTIIPLDIAYLTHEGEVVGLYTMAPLDTRMQQYPSKGPARLALEVNAHVLTQLGLKDGDRIEIPESVLKRAE